MKFLRIVVGTAVAAVLSAPVVGAQAAPTTGAEVFQGMRDAYAGTWYRTLRFAQKTTQRRADGTLVISTWFESLRQTEDATQLRIDFGDPRQGNGVLYTADSTWRVANGKVTGTQGKGNEFLPLIEGVYLQPVGRTVAQLASTGVDMNRVITGTLENQATWIIGAASTADTTSPQIWIDRERNVVVRMILVSGPGAPAMDVHLTDYVHVGRGWLATKVTMFVGGAMRQTEEYADWKVDVNLPDAMFRLSTWTTAPHWADR